MRKRALLRPQIFLILKNLHWGPHQSATDDQSLSVYLSMVCWTWTHLPHPQSPPRKVWFGCWEIIDNLVDSVYVWQCKQPNFVLKINSWRPKIGALEKKWFPHLAVTFASFVFSALKNRILSQEDHLSWFVFTQSKWKLWQYPWWKRKSKLSPTDEVSEFIKLLVFKKEQCSCILTEQFHTNPSSYGCHWTAPCLFLEPICQ